MALVAVATLGCGDTATTGWSDPNGATLASGLELDAGSPAISVAIELPPGYEPADEFVQRATLRSSHGEQTDTQSGLDRAFRLEPASEDAYELELILGFCESDVKEVCYVDTATLAVVVRAAADDEAPRSTAVRSIVYRPEAPK